MASRRGRIGDYTRAKLDSIISSSINSIETDAVPGGSNMEIQYNDGGSFGGISSFLWNDLALIAMDNTKLYFGSNFDGHLEYDEDGTDQLVLSGAAGGLAVSGGAVYFDVGATDTVWSGTYGNVESTNFLALNTSGKLVITSSMPPGEGVPGGTTNNLQFNRTTTTFGGISTFNVGTAGHLGAQSISGSDNAAIYFGDTVPSSGDADSYIVWDASRGDGILELSASSDGVAVTGSTIALVSDDKVWSKTNDTYVGAVDTTNADLYFTGSTNTGRIAWREGQDHFIIYDDVVILDEEKLYFGTDNDSYIEYETTDSYLVISGSSAGIAMSGSSLTASTENGFTIYNPAEGGTAYLRLIADQGDNSSDTFTISVPDGADGTTITNYGNLIIDTEDELTFDLYERLLIKSQGVTRGTIETDIPGEFSVTDATEQIVFAVTGSTLRMGHDKKIVFGNSAKSYIEYNATSNKLIMSGAHGGTYFSGSSIHVGPLGAAGTTYGPSTTTPVTAFDTITDLGTTASDGTACDMISDGQMGGQMIRVGDCDSSVNVVGELVSLYRGTWYAVDANDTLGAKMADRMLAIAMAVDGDADEGLVLLRGIARIPSTLFTGTTPVNNYAGDPLYASETEGEITLDIPRTSGAIVRVIGYLLDASGSDGLIYFNPDNTWVTIA
jgi:hypothetical protein